MATKLQMYSQMAEHSTMRTTQSREQWTSFLETASRLYKYPFNEQLMIFTQRPDAQACAPLEIWNEPMNRWVRRGSKGIALIDTTGDKPRLKYVFDLADTEESWRELQNGSRPRRPFIWELREEHEAPVMETLANVYDSEAQGDLGTIIYEIAGKLAAEYYDDNRRDIAYAIEGSYLEDLDELNVEVAYREALTVSVAYSLMTRCGVNTEDYFENEDFMPVFDFNTADAVNALGTGVSELTEQVLREVEITIKNYERQKAAERSNTHGQLDIFRQRGLSDSRPDADRADRRTDRQIRPDASELPQRPPNNIVQFNGNERNPVPASDRDQQDSGAEIGNADVGVDTAEPAPGQGERPDGLGTTHEQSETSSGRTDTDRVDLQLTPALSMDDASLNELLANSALESADIDNILREASNQTNGDQRIFLKYAHDLPQADIAAFLRDEYRTGGKGFQMGTKEVAAWWDRDGMLIGVGKSALQAKDRIFMPWEQVETRVRNLVQSGAYISTERVAQAADNEYKRLADQLIFTYRDDMRDICETPEEWEENGRGYPDMEAKVSSLLASPETRNTIVSTLQSDIEVLKSRSDERQRHYHDVDKVLSDLQVLQRPMVSLEQETSQSNPGFPFITGDEIDAFLSRGSSFSDGKARIMEHFLSEHTLKESADFLKQEYGTGGGSHALSRADDSHEDHGTKGLTLSRGRIGNPYAKAELNWNTAAKRIDTLINEGRFFTQSDIADFRERYTQSRVASSITSFYYNVSNDLLPSGAEKPFAETYDPSDKTKEVAAKLGDTEQVDSICATMESVFPLLDKNIRNYNSKAKCLETVQSFRDGTLDLIPLLSTVPVPEIIMSTTAAIPIAANEQLQLTLFPTEKEQKEKVAIAEGLNPSVFSVSDEEIDALLINALERTESRQRIVDQFSTNPRSREAANMLKDEYSSLTFTMPRTDGEAGYIGLLGEDKGVAISKSAPLSGPLSERQPVDTITLPWPKVQRRIAQLVETGALIAADRTPTQDIDSFRLETPEQIAVATEPDFEAIAKTVLERVMQDEDYVSALTTATSRASLRNPCAWAVEDSIRTHEKDEPAIFNLFFSGMEWREKLHNRILRDSYANRPTPEQTQRPETEYQDNAPTAEAETPPTAAQVEPIVAAPVTEHSIEEQIRAELDERGFVVSDEMIEEGIEDYRSRAGSGDFQDISDFIENEYLTEDEAMQQDIGESVSAGNFRITDDNLGHGGAKAKYQMNVDAIRTLKQIESENRLATTAEQETLSKYVGWGGLAQAFDSERTGWTNEYAELRELLSDDEYSLARASTLNAHYTAPTVIKAMYDAVEQMGFKSGNILEPACGIGNFFGMLPESMANSKLYGVELDSITGRISQQLYQDADIRITGFEKTGTPDALFDLAIGNVPFGNYKVPDKRYDKNNFAIHDYFFAKALDQVRPGGVIAFISSNGTLDKANPNVRKYIAQRAELLGAIRLPNDAFLKNAGTEVTTDIIFLQKRDRLMDIQPDWVHLGQTEDGVPVNSYFADHPEMILGKMVFDESMYGDTKDTACHPIEGADLAVQLHEAVRNIHGQITEMEFDETDAPKDVSIPADPDVRNYSYTLVDDTVYFRENSRMSPAEMPAATLERVKGMVQLRDCVHSLIECQLEEYGDQVIAEKQAELNQLYDTFTKKHGLINASANSRAFSNDSAYYLLCSLEVLDENGELERKADMFSKRTIKQKSVITSVDTASEALTVSIAERARVDLDFMQSLTGISEEKLLENLRGAVYADYDFDVYSNNIQHCQVNGCTYRTADDFLSGNVREKLQHYKDALEVLPADSPYRQSFSDNVTALEAVQPKDLDASEISVRLGSTWVDKRYIEQFVHETLQPPSYLSDAIRVNYFDYTGEWNVTAHRRVPSNNVLANVTYGTSRMNAYRIIEDTLNLKDVRVYDTKFVDGKETRELNKKETTLAQQKQEAIKQAFNDWVFKDPDRRRDLVKLYNERFNSSRPREYDGSHINFSGISPDITLRPHQLNAIAHVLYGGNTLLAHEVGAGKTFEMVASAMELKRLGLAQKSMFAVPNHLTEQWASEFLRLYPSANILVATAKDFEMKNRKKFCAKIATGDYDAVIIGHSQLEKIPMSKERQERLLDEQISEITMGIDELKRNDGERFSIKQLEKTRKSLEARLAKLNDDSRKDDVVTFEQLGVDRLFVDEAHSFKNLFLHTKMRNVAGISQTEAQKSSDLFGKCRYLDEETKGKGVIFATGTPISNSMTEMYTMQRYLQYETLKKNNLTHFDCWASTFGETTTAIELAPEGTGYRARTRFAKFHNLPELMCMFKEVADIKTADMMNLPRPKANYNTVVVKPSELQTEMVKDLSKRAAIVHRNGVDPSEDNMLKITSDGRKIGLDQRLINPMLPDDEGSKVNACMKDVYRIWDETKADRLTQLVFCDFSTPNKDGRFNVYDDIRDKLLQKGIPEDEIAFIHEANTEIRKKELFAKVRTGKVRVLFGSTFKMGSGTNVQDRLIHLHDLDCPWRPSDLEQRAGRIVRQGNMNPEVGITRYVTEGTFDAYLYQTIENKQKFISQIMSSKSPVRSCEDVDETALSYAEIKALCAGNPLIKEKMDLDIEVARLRLLKADHQSQLYKLEDDLLTNYPQSIERAKEQIAGFKDDKARIEAGTQPNADGFSPMEINGSVHREKKQAGESLLEACKQVKGADAVKIGSYRGLDMNLAFDTLNKQFVLSLKGSMRYGNSHAGTLLGVALGTDVFGNITRINNAIEELPQRLDSVQKHLENQYKQVENAKQELQKPFPFEEQLNEKSTRLAFLDAELNMDSSHEQREEPEQIKLDSVAKAPHRAAIAKGKPSILESLKTAAAEIKATPDKPKAAEISI